VVPNPPAELLLEVDVVVLAALAEVALAVAGFESPLVAAGLSVFKIVGMI
jgi:hypothetical protein